MPPVDPLGQQPVPQSPPEAPGIPGEVPGMPGGAPGALSQEQMKGNLQDLMSKIEGKYQDFNSQKFASGNKAREQQSEALRQVFDLLQSLGIDPSNVEEVKAFLDQIRETNPELSQQLEVALEALLGTEDEDLVPMQEEMPVSEELPLGQEGMPLEENMNINNETPPETV